MVSACGVQRTCKQLINFILDINTIDLGISVTWITNRSLSTSEGSGQTCVWSFYLRSKKLESVDKNSFQAFSLIGKVKNAKTLLAKFWMHAIKHRSLYKGGPSHTLFIASSSSMTYNVLHICDVEQRKNWEVTGSTIKSETSRCTAGLNSCVPAEP